MNRTHDLSLVTWRKSSYSDGGDGNCVEVADGFPGVVPVRDSKVAGGPVVLVSAEAWGVFVAGFRRGDVGIGGVV